MSGFKSYSEDFDRVFFTEQELVDQFVGEALYTWGSNNVGRLGDGSTTNRSSPGTVSGQGTNWKQIDAGNAYTAGIKTDGTLWTWGNNGDGRLGDGSTTSRSSPGTVSGEGTNWKNVSVTSSGSQTAAIKTDGTLWTWGGNTSGQLGDGSTTSRSSPGTVSGAGTNWKQVSAGSLQMAAIKTDGTLWTWGGDTYGQLGDGSTTSRSSPGTTSGGGTNWKQVSAGGSGVGSRTAAIKTDGTLWTWGSAASGSLGDGSTTDRSSPGTVSGGGTTWKQVSCGQTHIAAIKIDGTLWTWGLNSSGQLGDGSTTDRSSPGTVSGGGTNWKQVSCGFSLNIAAIKTDGTLWTWGSATSGSLGDGTTTSRSSPGITTSNLSYWKQVSTGFSHTAAIGEY